MQSFEIFDLDTAFPSVTLTTLKMVSNAMRIKELIEENSKIIRLLTALFI